MAISVAFLVVCSAAPLPGEASGFAVAVEGGPWMVPPADAPARGVAPSFERAAGGGGPVHVRHPPIFIDSDDDFTIGGVAPNVANGVVGGAGTAADPYRIEGWDIPPLVGGSSGIYVKGTTVHVLIRDNVVRDQFVSASDPSSTLGGRTGAGIKVVNARNVRIEDNELRDNAFNLVLYGSRLVQVHGNTMTGGVEGWWMEEMTGPVTATGNAVWDNFRNFGVFSQLAITAVGYVHTIDATNTVQGLPVRYLVGASNLVLDNATTAAGFVGIVNGNNVRVTGYRFEGNLVGGLAAGGSGVRFDNVTATLNEKAVLLSHTTGATVADTHFEWNTAGVWLERASNSRVTHNWFGNQSRGCCPAMGVLLHYRADDDRIDNNTFYKNEAGVNVIGFGGGTGCPLRAKLRDNNFDLNGLGVFEEFEWVLCLPNTVDARRNYWGAANGPDSAEGNALPSGDGDGVTENVLYAPFHAAAVPGTGPRP